MLITENQFSKRISLTLFLFAIAGFLFPFHLEAQKGKKLQKLQQDYLPSVAREQGLFLGMTVDQFKNAFPEAIPAKTGHGEALEYIIHSPSVEVKTLHVRCHPTEQVVYRLQLSYLVPEANEEAKRVLGPCYRGGEEWVFMPEDTGLPFSLVSWSQPDQLIVAAGLEKAAQQELFDRQQLLMPDLFRQEQLYLGMSRDEFLLARPRSGFTDSEDPDYWKYAENSPYDGISRLTTYINRNSGAVAKFAISYKLLDPKVEGKRLLGNQNPDQKWYYNAEIISLPFSLEAWTEGRNLVYASILGQNKVEQEMIGE